MNEPATHHLTQVGSTLDVLHEYAARGAPHGTVVVADEQLEGRGTRGKTWHSPLGGLWYSMLFRDVTEMTMETLSLRIGLSVTTTIDSVLPDLHVAVKWPNDLILDDRKLGGILCEARWQGGALDWVVMGLGLNVANQIPLEVAGSATSLGTFVPGIRPDILIGPVTTGLRSLAADAGTLDAAELEAFAGRDWLRGKELMEPEKGRAEGIESNGTLRVKREDGTVVLVRAGHVVLA